MVLPERHLSEEEHIANRKEVISAMYEILSKHYTILGGEHELHGVALAALRKFLSGRTKSLDEAFNLTRKVGTLKTNPLYKQAVIKAAVSLHLKGVSYSDIPELLEKQGFNRHDEKTLRQWKNSNKSKLWGNIGLLEALALRDIDEENRA